MTGSLPQPLPIDPDPWVPPAPEPEPIPAPPRGRFRAGWLVALALLGVAGLCALVYAFVAPIVLDIIPGMLAGSDLEGEVWWAADGDYLVAQLADDEVPYVVVWERATGKSREHRGVRAVAVEPHAPRVWLAANDGGQRDPSAEFWEPLDVAGDDEDAPPASLLLWDLSAGGPPREVADTRWSPWPGPGGTTALLEVDAHKGAAPSRLLFQPSSAQGESVEADLPDDVVTFDPIGWSPSGEYFAIHALMVRETNGAGGRPANEEALVGDNRRLIVSARTGKVATEERRDDEVVYGTLGIHGAWDTEQDILYFMSAEEIAEPDDGDGPVWSDSAPTERYFVRYLMPGGRHGEASSLAGWRDPEPLESTWRAGLVGVTPEGLLVEIDGGGPMELWSAGRSARRIRGSKDSFLESSSAFSTAGGLAYIEFGDKGPALFSGKLGSPRTKVWEAEEQ